MHTTKIWLYEPFPFLLLNKESQKIALENVRKEIQKEAPELMHIGKEFLEAKASLEYMFLKSGKIYKKKEEVR